MSFEAFLSCPVGISFTASFSEMRHFSPINNSTCKVRLNLIANGKGTCFKEIDPCVHLKDADYHRREAEERRRKEEKEEEKKRKLRDNLN